MPALVDVAREQLAAAERSVALALGPPDRAAGPVARAARRQGVCVV